MRSIECVGALVAFLVAVGLWTAAQRARVAPGVSAEADQRIADRTTQLLSAVWPDIDSLRLTASLAETMTPRHGARRVRRIDCRTAGARYIGTLQWDPATCTLLDATIDLYDSKRLAPSDRSSNDRLSRAALRQVSWNLLCLTGIASQRADWRVVPNLPRTPGSGFTTWKGQGLVARLHVDEETGELLTLTVHTPEARMSASPAVPRTRRGPAERSKVVCAARMGKSDPAIRLVAEGL